MFLKVKCESCGEKYRLTDAISDASDKYYCPFCNSEINNYYSEKIEFVKNWRFYLLMLLGYIAASVIGLVTKTLNYVAPAMVAWFGILMATRSSLRDHRIIGLFLVFVAVIAFLFVQNVA